MGTTKVKGIFKGLRYISQIFDERKEPEMKIGLPTDVKHVAHIGWDGPSADSPSWMKGYESMSGSNPSAPLTITEPKPKAVQEILEDLKRGHRKSLKGGRDQPDLPKSTRHSSSSKDKASPETDSPKKQKSRNSRRHHLKDSSDSSTTSRLSRESTGTIDSPPNDLPDVPKKSRRKKTKDPNNSTTHHRPSRSRRGSSGGSGSSFASCTSDLDSSPVKSTFSNKYDRYRNEVG